MDDVSVDEPLVWRRSVNEPDLSVWTADAYRLVSEGLVLHGANRRDWRLYFRERLIGTAAQLQDGKRQAEQHRNDRERDS